MRYASRKLTPPLALALFVVVLITSCGGTLIQSIRASIAASAPLRSSLVASGAISQELSDRLGTDFSDGATCAETLQTDFRAIPKDDPEAKAKKLNAGVKAGRCWRVVVERQNFAKNDKVKRAADIIDGIFSAVIVFYSEPGVMRASADGQARRTVDETKLNDDLETRLKDLKEAMKP